METASEAVLMCSKCEERPRADPTGKKPWCLECNAEYQRNYVAGLKKQTAQQSFARGVAAMKRCLAAEFYRCGGNFASGEIIHLIMQAPGPSFEEGPEPRA
jgi:hypothetical protein